MKKRIITPTRKESELPDQDWLNLEDIAEVGITSEDAAYPIESALLIMRTSGWRAEIPGQQTIRLLFKVPLNLRQIKLKFVENYIERTQEYVLRWSPDDGQTFHEIARQQWNFSPLGSTSETEYHHVDLTAVTVLELNIIPDISGKDALAKLEQWRLA